MKSTDFNLTPDETAMMWVVAYGVAFAAVLTGSVAHNGVGTTADELLDSVDKLARAAATRFERTVIEKGEELKAAARAPTAPT